MSDSAKTMGPEGYGAGMHRQEVPAGWAQGVAAEVPRVVVVPVINVEVFLPGAGGPGVQPHLNSVPEVANSGWRNYGNRSGLRRLVQLFEELRYPIQVTKVGPSFGLKYGAISQLQSSNTVPYWPSGSQFGYQLYENFLIQ